MNLEYNIGDIVELKKKHPCGSKTFEITRIGVDFKFKCIRLRPCNSNGKTKGNKDDKKKIR